MDEYLFILRPLNIWRVPLLSIISPPDEVKRKTYEDCEVSPVLTVRSMLFFLKKFLKSNSSVSSKNANVLNFLDSTSFEMIYLPIWLRKLLFFSNSALSSLGMSRATSSRQPVTTSVAQRTKQARRKKLFIIAIMKITLQNGCSAGSPWAAVCPPRHGCRANRRGPCPSR